MDTFKTLIPLRDYCRERKWPRLTQWHHWIYNQSPIAQKCIKKIGGRYLVDLVALENYIVKATLEEPVCHRKLQKRKSSFSQSVDHSS